MSLVWEVLGKEVPRNLFALRLVSGNRSEETIGFFRATGIY